MNVIICCCVLSLLLFAFSCPTLCARRRCACRTARAFPERTLFARILDCVHDLVVLQVDDRLDQLPQLPVRVQRDAVIG